MRGMFLFAPKESTCPPEMGPLTCPNRRCLLSLWLLHYLCPSLSVAASGERVSVYEKGDNFEFLDRVRRGLGVCFLRDSQEESRLLGN